MSTNALVFGANGYIGFGVAVGLRRAGLRVFGVVRQNHHSTRLLQHEIEPVVIESFENVSSLAEHLQRCSVIVDAVGYKAEFSEKILQVVHKAGQERTENGSNAHYAPLFIFTSGIMTYGDTSIHGRRPMDEMTRPKPMTNEMKAREAYENHVLASSSNCLHTTVVRPGFVYGGHGGFVADLFYSQKPAIIDGRRDKRWSWVHIDDLADAYALLTRAPRVIVTGQMWNIAAPNDNPTYEDIRTKMATVSGHTVEYKDQTGNNQVPVRWDTDSIINPSKAIDQLGWRPKHVGYLEEIEIYYRSWLAHKQGESSSSGSHH